MEDWMERVFDESNELEKKILKLRYFVESGQFITVPPEEQELLKKQHEIMLNYVNILKSRISKF